MRTTLILIFSMVGCIYTALHAQEQERYYGGVVLNDSAYELIPKKPVLLTRSYEVLPASYSLRKFCPAVGAQGRYSTCTSWASAYAARTIAEAVINNWQSTQSSAEAFSPLFVYSLSRGENSGNCQTGIYLDAAFQTLKTRGAAKYRDFSYDCTSHVAIPSELYPKAQTNAIDNYFALFSAKDSHEKKIITTKKSISENRPVVVSMANYVSFQKNDEEVWSGTADVMDGYHAMCVVAYDNNKDGGAFLLMNSWGPRWGDNGFKWVKYTDYSKYVNYAMEMYVKKKATTLQTTLSVTRPHSTPITAPTEPAQTELNNLAGELNFVLSTGQKMRPRLYNANRNPYYVLEGSYISGTRYRLYVSNHEPAYVYIIGSDLTNAVSKVFPPHDQISAALVYQSNEIAIPDEKWYIQMDNTTGKDYACVLYSRDELPINDIVHRIKAESGSFLEKINKVLADKIVPARDIKYDYSAIRFSVKNTDKTVVPIIVEIDHR